MVRDANRATADSAGTIVALLAFAVAAVLYLGGIAHYPLLDPDEGRYAEIPREMLESGDWITPHLNYVKYLEKPPLLYWLVGGAFRLFGVDEGAARLVPALAGLCTIVMVYRLGIRLAGRRAALFSAAFLATSPLFFGMSQILTMDMLLCASITLAMACFWRAHTASDQRWWALATAFGVALAVLSKGLVGLALPGMAGLLFLLCARDFTTMRALMSPAPIAVFAVIAVPWFVLVSIKNPEFVNFFFIHEHVGRFAFNKGHPEGLLHYLPILVTAPLPWTAMAAGLAATRAGRDAFVEVPHHTRLFLLLWAGVVIVFFSVANCKIAQYILPAFPPLALLAGAWIDRVLDRRELGAAIVRWLAIAFVVAGGVILVTSTTAWTFAERIAAWITEDSVDVRTVARGLFAVGAALLAGGLLVTRPSQRLRLSPGRGLAVLALAMAAALFATTPSRTIVRTSQVLARAIEEHRQPGDLIACYEKFMHGLVFYTRSRITLVRGFQELKYGREWTADREAYFWKKRRRLARVWRSDRRVFLATHRAKLGRLKELLDPPPRIIASDRRRVLLVNFPPAGSPPDRSRNSRRSAQSPALRVTARMPTYP